MALNHHGYIHADGRILRDQNGKEFLLRGVGLGTWLLPEGYMLRLPAAADRPRRIERAIQELLGPKESAHFWKRFRERYIAESDLKRIADEGFNSVRLPLSYRLLTDDAGVFDPSSPGVAAIDRSLAWSRTYGLSVILDLHAAPGGQTGANIDDSIADHPDLFIEPRHRATLIELWRELAKRYRDEPAIAGYDLLNEPLPDHFSRYNDMVVPLYRDIIGAIREVDRNHLIILEGVHWATDWSIFSERLDDNILYQFHKYWNAPDTDSIRPYLEARERLDAPIFMGEGGENNIEWYTGAFSLFEDFGISWNFWTWKKMTTDNSPCSIVMPKGWERLVSWLEGGEKPGFEEARAILEAYLEGLPFEACAYRRSVVDALFRRTPVTIPAIFFGHTRNEDFHTLRLHAGIPGFRSDEGVDIRPLIENGFGSPNFKHGGGEKWTDRDWMYVRIHPGERFSYRFFVTCRSGADGTKPQEGSVTLRLRSMSPGATLTLKIDYGHAETLRELPAAWDEVTVRLTALREGPHRIELSNVAAVDDSAIDMLHLRFE